MASGFHLGVATLVAVGIVPLLVYATLDGPDGVASPSRSIDVTTDRESYSRGDVVHINVRNTGDVSLPGPPKAWLLTLNATVLHMFEQNGTDAVLRPDQTISWTWQTLKASDDCPEEGPGAEGHVGCPLIGGGEGAAQEPAAGPNGTQAPPLQAQSYVLLVVVGEEADATAIRLR